MSYESAYCLYAAQSVQSILRLLLLVGVLSVWLLDFGVFLIVAAVVVAVDVDGCGTVTNTSSSSSSVSSGNDICCGFTERRNWGLCVGCGRGTSSTGQSVFTFDGSFRDFLTVCCFGVRLSEMFRYLCNSAT